MSLFIDECISNENINLKVVDSSLIEFCYLLQGRQLAQLLDENPELMERRQQCAKRLQLCKAARDEIDAVSWSR